MASILLGVIRNTSGKVVAIVNPDDDRELIDPCWNFGRDDNEMILIPRGENAEELSFDDVAALVEKYQR
jgi:hypothetical protein